MKGQNKNSGGADGKLPWAVKAGVSFGSLCDSVPYYLFYTYFLYYLTNIAGISPAIAGVICSAAIVYDGGVDPFIGYLSDNSKNPKGRRIPVIKKGAAVLAAALVLLFFPNHFTGAAQIVYYLFTVLLLWTGYSFITIPWQALNAELTDDYHERNRLMTTICVVALPFTAISNSGPMWLQNLLMPMGFTEAGCWFVTGICGAVLVIIGAAVVSVSCKGRETAQGTKDDLTESLSVKGFLETLWNLLKLKQYRIILINGLFFMASYTLCNAMLIYALKFNALMNETQIGLFWSVFAVFTTAGAPVSALLAGKTDKKVSYMIFCAVMIISFAAYYFIGTPAPVYAYVFSGLFSFGTAGFWTMYYSMAADNVQLYEFIYGKKREGAIASLNSFVITGGGALSSLLAGFSLELIGYSGGVTVTESIAGGIWGMTTLAPAGMQGIAMLVLAGYKLNKKEYGALKDALEMKNQGKAYSTELFDKVL
jgi:GPH family glycoside/pentoside/hexuronide:cation symporter